jgi:hypothetical protein
LNHQGVFFIFRSGYFEHRNITYQCVFFAVVTAPRKALEVTKAQIKAHNRPLVSDLLGIPGKDIYLLQDI